MSPHSILNNRFGERRVKKTDNELSLDREISRRDFIHDAEVATPDLSLPISTY